MSAALPGKKCDDLVVVVLVKGNGPSADAAAEDDEAESG